MDRRAEFVVNRGGRGEGRKEGRQAYTGNALYLNQRYLRSRREFPGELRTEAGEDARRRSGEVGREQ